MTNGPILLTIILVLATAVSVPGCHRDSNLTEQELINRAKDFEDKGNLKGSILELKNAVQKNPNSPQARLLLGQIYLKAGMGVEAEKELTKAEKLGVNHETIQIQLGEALLSIGENKRVLDEIQAGPETSKVNLARIQQIRADAMLNQGKIEDACELYKRSLETDANNPPTYWGLAKCAVAKSDATKARELLDAALKINDKKSMTWVYVGDLERRNSNTQGALAAYGNALKVDPNNLRALDDRIRVNLSLGQVEPARQDLGRFLELAPKSRTAYYLQALLDLQTNKYPEALDALQQVLRITPDYLPALLAYATVSYGLGHYEQSISSASKILGAAPGYIPAAKILAGSLLKTGDVNGALKTLAPLLPRHPDDVQLLALAGDTYFRAKDYNKAMEYLDRASILDPHNAVIKTRLAAGHLAEGESDKALAALEQAASLNTSPGQADLALVTLHLQRKEFDQALQAIAALEKKLPNNPVIHNLRAAALLGKQDRAGARKALEQALAIQPTFFPAAINLARLDMADNKPDAAKKRFEAILEKDKNNAQALMALADLAAIQKQESEYVNWLERAAKADSKAIKPRTALARYYLAKKDSRKALAVANEAVSANPDSLEALNLLGATQMATGDKAASVTTFTRMAQKAPQSPGVLLALARAQIFNKELGNARVNLQQALKVKPDFLQAQETLMWVELSDSKPDAALQIARQLQTQQPRSPIGFGNEGDILLTQKKYPQAVKAYELAISKGAGSSVLIKLHRAYLLAGDAKAADQRLAAWIKQHPKDAVVRTYAAEYYTSSNRNRDAIVQYEEVLKLTPQSALALNNLAGLYQREKDGRALATAEKALKLAPEHPGVQDTLGWILLEQGQLPRAVELLGKAAAKVPKAGPIRYHYGAALARVGKKAEARRELEAAIATGQKFPELEEAKALLKSL